MDGSAYGRIIEGWAALFKAMVVLLIIFVPLGMWKAVELIIWLCKNVNVSFGG